MKSIQCFVSLHKVIKQTNTFFMKKHTLNYVFIFIIVYSLGYIVEFTCSKGTLENDINDFFKKSILSMHDSIRSITGEYLYYVYDEKHINKRLDLICVSNEGEIRISRDIINIENPQEYHKKNLESIMLEDDSYNLYIADSIWNKQLKENGYCVNAILFLSVKSLKDMFPKRDSLVTNLKAPFVSVNSLAGKECFVTDSVGLGICNQGYILSHVHIPTLTVVKHTKWWGSALWIAISVILFLALISAFRKYIIEKKYKTHYKEIAESVKTIKDKNIIKLGHITYSPQDDTLYNTITKQQLKLPRTQAQVMELLATSKDYYVTKNEICQALWSLDDKAVPKTYNSLCFRLRNSLESIDGIKLVTIKDTALQLVIYSPSEEQDKK